MYGSLGSTLYQHRVHLDILYLRRDLSETNVSELVLEKFLTELNVKRKFVLDTARSLIEVLFLIKASVLPYIVFLPAWMHKI